MTQKKIDIPNTNLYATDVKELLIQALGNSKDAMDVIRELAEGMFPNDDLETRVLERKIQNEVNDMAKEYPDKLDLADFYVEDVAHNFYFDFNSPSSFIEMHSYLSDFQDYLVHKYQANIDFNYRIYEYKGYKSEQSKEEKPVEKPKPVPTFDIELNEAV